MQTFHLKHVADIIIMNLKVNLSKYSAYPLSDTGPVGEKMCQSVFLDLIDCYINYKLSKWPHLGRSLW